MDKPTNLADRPGTGPLDPRFQRAALLIGLDLVELTRIIPQAQPEEGKARY